MAKAAPLLPVAAPSGIVTRNARGFVVRLAASPAFSYATILLLQLKTIWGVWDSIRLGSGDTSFYFLAAQRFADFGDLPNLVYSPLYVMFYGTVYAVLGDPFMATLVHRIAIVLVAAMAALAVFRRLLPPPFAWCAAAWWAASPIIFNTLYEVHLFGALPVLVACIVAAATNSPWGRGIALAILALGGVLVRNELTAAAAIYGCGCFCWEWFDRGRGTRATTVLVAYASPLLIAAGVVAALHAQVPRGFDLDRAMDDRHGLNMAQVFAVGYQQRNPEWRHNPWTESHDLMVEFFGSPTPSIGAMLRSNPRALFEHFLWNLRLTPNGLQLLLFSEISGELNPDYPPPPSNSKRALILTILLALLWIAGGRKLVTGWNDWWTGSIRPRAPVWLVLVSTSLVAPLVILMQRPRPSYLFGLAAFLMAFSALCGAALVRAYPRLERIAIWWPLAALAVIAAVPRIFATEPAHHSQVFTHVERLLPHRLTLSGPGEKLYSPGSWQGIVQNYICPQNCWASGEHAGPVSIDALAVSLEASGFTALYADEDFLQKLEALPGRSRPFVEILPDPWQLVAFDDGERGRWRLFHRGVPH